MCLLGLQDEAPRYSVFSLEREYYRRKIVNIRKRKYDYSKLGQKCVSGNESFLIKRAYADSQNCGSFCASSAVSMVSEGMIVAHMQMNI